MPKRDDHTVKPCVYLIDIDVISIADEPKALSQSAFLRELRGITPEAPMTTAEQWLLIGLMQTIVDNGDQVAFISASKNVDKLQVAVDTLMQRCFMPAYNDPTHLFAADTSLENAMENLQQHDAGQKILVTNHIMMFRYLFFHVAYRRCRHLQIPLTYETFLDNFSKIEKMVAVLLCSGFNAENYSLVCKNVAPFDAFVGAEFVQAHEKVLDAFTKAHRLAPRISGFGNYEIKLLANRHLRELILYLGDNLTLSSYQALIDNPGRFQQVKQLLLTKNIKSAQAIDHITASAYLCDIVENNPSDALLKTLNTPVPWLKLAVIFMTEGMQAAKVATTSAYKKKLIADALQSLATLMSVSEIMPSRVDAVQRLFSDMQNQLAQPYGCLWAAEYEKTKSYLAAADSFEQAAFALSHLPMPNH